MLIRFVQAELFALETPGMLTNEQKEELAGLLQAMTERRETETREARSGSRTRDQNAIGRDSIDESASETLLGTQLRLADRGKKIGSQAAQALLRLEQGVLDECEDCSEPISFRRLRARPMTTLCVPCQEEREEEEAAEAVLDSD